jgi:hypothetical protein
MLCLNTPEEVQNWFKWQLMLLKSLSWDDNRQDGDLQQLF